MVMLFASMTTTALAAEPAVSEVASQENNGNEGIMPLASGYAAHYTDALTGSFYINVTGSGGILGKAKLKAWDFPSTAEVYVSLYRPDGSAAVTNVKLPIGQEISKTFTNLQTGSYRLFYTVAGVDKGWIYCNIN